MRLGRVVLQFTKALPEADLTGHVDSGVRFGRPFRAISRFVTFPGLKPWAILFSPFRRARRALVTNASHRWMRVTVELEPGWAKSPRAKARAVAAVWIAERLWKR